jgi:hypothetical protein
MFGYFFLIGLIVGGIVFVTSASKLNSCLTSATSNIRSGASFLTLDQEIVCRKNLDLFKTMSSCIATVKTENPVVEALSKKMVLFPARSEVNLAIVKHNKNCPDFPATRYLP